jgi:hypothetical protein
MVRIFVGPVIAVVRPANQQSRHARSEIIPTISLLLLAALLAVFIGLAHQFGFFSVLPHPRALVDSSPILVLGTLGIFKRFDRWWTFSFLCSVALILLNCFVIETLTGHWGWGLFHTAGAEHWWLCQISYGLGLFTLVHGASGLVRDRSADLVFRSILICLILITIFVAISAVTESMAIQQTSIHDQNSFHLERGKIFLGCLMYSVAVKVGLRLARGVGTA